MKYVLVIGDGMADAPLGQLAGRTPLEALALPAFDRAAGCRFGQVLTVPQGLAPGSDTAILSIFGYDPRAHYTGRSVLEAAGMGVILPAGSLSFRVNLCAVEEDQGQPVLRSHNGGNIHGREALGLMEALLAHPGFAARMKEARMDVTVTDTFRHIGVMESSASDLAALCLTEPHNVLDQGVEGNLPRLARETGDEAVRRLCADLRDLMLLSYEVLKDHPINRERRAQGKLPADMIWPWGAATAMELDSFADKYGHGGSVISAVPLVWGIATLAGLKTPRVPGANGDLDTNYEGKADAAVEALLRGGDDFVAVHVEAPDEMAHAGNLAGKLEAIQNIESRVVARVLDKLWASGEDFRLLLLSDHPTLMTTRTHDGSPVPYAIYDSRTVRAAIAVGGEEPRAKFCEKGMRGRLLIHEGTELMPLLFELRI